MIKRLICKSDTLLFCAIPFFILISCVSTRSIPADQISKTPSWKNLYYFHAEDSTWIVKPVPAAGNQFAGIIYKPEVVKKNRQVHIYAAPLSAVKTGNGQLSVPMENIVKVENYRINTGTVIASVGAVALLFLLPVIL
jgi:hypothetical protein